MNSWIIYLLAAVACFLVSIFFFRKESVPIEKAFLPLFMNILSPTKMKQYFKVEGLWLIGAGYICLLIFLIMFPL